MTTIWEEYPSSYRAKETGLILQAIRAGECVSVVGLSGAGKSNLLGFLANRGDLPGERNPQRVLVDCNRLRESSPEALLRLVCQVLEAPDAEATQEAADAWQMLDKAVNYLLQKAPSGLCILLDRFDRLDSADPALAGAIRALRDAHKYALTFIIASRQPMDLASEMAELFYANSVWLGPLVESDALWSIERFAQRRGINWDESTARTLISLTRGYPSLLRAACEAHAAGCALHTPDLLAHPAVQRRLDEFWKDQPVEAELRRSGLEGLALVAYPTVEAGQSAGRAEEKWDTSHLTAKEHRLLRYFQEHPNEVCEKDDLICAIWTEDQVYERGLRDDSLAQLVRRLREKIEADPSNPQYIHTIPGRGYRFTQSG